MTELWTEDKEIEFFTEALKLSTPEKLFYLSNDDRYYAYWPKAYKGKKDTLQSRNAFIGDFTEKYSANLLQSFAQSKGLYALQGVVCKELDLTSQSPADIALCKTKAKDQSAENIVALIEVKMSIVWNWEFKNRQLICLGDFTTHKGNPGLLRSDTMLKAIGKSIDIRVTRHHASRIPIVVLGNTPITQSYTDKVDNLKRAGIIQGFWSVNPNPLEGDGGNLKNTPRNGFMRMDSSSELEQNFEKLLTDESEFLSGWLSKSELGKIIKIANQEKELEQKAEKLLSLIRSQK